MIATAAQLYNHAYPDRKMLFGRHSSLKQCFGIHAASPGLCKMLIVNFYMITWTHTQSCHLNFSQHIAYSSYHSSQNKDIALITPS